MIFFLSFFFKLWIRLLFNLFSTLLLLGEVGLLFFGFFYVSRHFLSFDGCGVGWEWVVYYQLFVALALPAPGCVPGYSCEVFGRVFSVFGGLDRFGVVVVLGPFLDNITSSQFHLSWV